MNSRKHVTMDMFPKICLCFHLSLITVQSTFAVYNLHLTFWTRSFSLHHGNITAKSEIKKMKDVKKNSG